jgi:hypothetical protein
LDALITFELNAPQPLFEVIATILFFTSRCVVYSPPHHLQELQKGFVIVPLIFRHKDAWQSHLVLSFAAETIFIADVICIVDETEVILLRISFKFAIFYL